MAIMSLRGYAKYRGVALSAVQKALKTGRISLTKDSKIDSAKADEDWERNTEKRIPAVLPRGDDEDSLGGTAYSKARAVRETFQARLAKLDYEERTKKLISADEVKVAAFNLFRRYRDHLLNIPDRVAAMVAAETDAARCYEIIAKEIRNALNEFSDAHSNGNGNGNGNG